MIYTSHCRVPRQADHPPGQQRVRELQLPAGVVRHLLLPPPHARGQVLASGESLQIITKKWA